MFALLIGRVQAVDIVAAGIVEEVGFGWRVGDVVAELPVGDWYAQWVEGFLGVH